MINGGISITTEKVWNTQNKHVKIMMIVFLEVYSPMNETNFTYSFHHYVLEDVYIKFEKNCSRICFDNFWHNWPYLHNRQKGNIISPE